MPVAAPIAAALTDASAHPYSLMVGGVDVIDQAGIPGNLYAVDLETIEVVEAGPGGVSSMTFTIDDPAKAISIANPVDVLFMDNVNNNVLFRGYTDRATPSPDFGGQGRTIAVECSGIEILLDWYIVTPQYLPIITNATLPQQLASMVQTFLPLLRAPCGPPFYSDPNYTRNGSFDFPVGTMARSATIVPIRTDAVFHPLLGGTVRNMINDQLQDAAWYDTGSSQITEIGVQTMVTVDFYYGLRIWEDGAGLQPDDYTTLTISDTYAGPNRAAGLGVKVDWSGVVRSVYVSGFDAASSGMFSDGSGIIGQTALVSDSSITSAALALSRAGGVMAANVGSARGSFRLEDWTPPITVHAGSLVSITDAATSVSTSYRIREIRKTFHGNGRQDWDVTFGNLPPASAAREIKRLVFPPRGLGAPG